MTWCRATSNETTAKGVCDKLYESYLRKMTGNKAFFVMKIVNLKYKET